MKLSKISLFILLAGLTTFFSSCNKSEDPVTPAVGSLKGTIYDENENIISSAKVYVASSQLGNSFQVESNEQGVYEFTDLPVGKYAVSVTKTDYDPGLKTNIVINENQTTISDFVLTPNIYRLSVSDTLLRVSTAANSRTVEVFSNTSKWEITYVSPWLECDKDKTFKNKYLHISWYANLYESRKGYVTIKAGNETVTITVDQPSAIQVNYKSFLGNQDKGLNDYSMIYFDRKINTISAFDVKTNIGTQAKWEMNEDNQSIRIDYPSSGALTSTLSVYLVVWDEYGNKLTKSMNINYYDVALSFKDEIVNYDIDDNNKMCWVISHSPVRLIEVNLEKLVKARELEIKDIFAYNVCYNPHNKLVYITGSESDTQIVVIDPESFTVKKLLNLGDDSPRNINFTKDGYGIISLTSKTTGTKSWKIIDSKKDDLIYTASNFQGPYNCFDSGFDIITTNSNNFLLYNSNPSVQCKFIVAKVDNNTFYSEAPPAELTNVSIETIIPNKANNEAFFKYDGNKKAIIDMKTKQVINITHPDSENAPIDFCYNNPHSNSSVFIMGNGNFSIFDYKTSKTIARYKYINIKGDVLRNTIGGKKTLMWKGKQLFIYSTDIFYEGV